MPEDGNAAWEPQLVLLVHIAPEGRAGRIRRNGIAPARVPVGWLPDPAHDRAVWSFPVLPSYTLTHSWARELKRRGATTLIAVTFRVDDDEPAYGRHFSSAPLALTAAAAAGMVRAQPDPRGYEIMLPRRIAAAEIVRIRTLPAAIGWRYWPEAKNQPLRLCDCPMCMPRGEVKARRYRTRVAAAIARENSGGGAPTGD